MAKAPFTKSPYDEEEVLKKLGEYIKETGGADENEIIGANGNAKVYKKVKLPSKTGFARYLGIGSTTLNRWINKHPALEEAMQHVIDAREEKLISNGLGGQYNSNITKLILTKHGYSDKIDQNVNANESLIHALELAHQRTIKQTSGSAGTGEGKSS